MKAVKPSDPNAVLQQAISLRDAGKWKEAAVLYRQLLTVAPRQPQLLTDLGTITLYLGDFREGVRLFGLSLEADPNQPLVLSNRAVGLKNLGRLEEALESADGAIRLMPGYADAHNNRGLVLHELGRFEDALASYGEAVRLHPGHAPAHHNRGRTLRRLGHFEEALAAYDRAIQLHPGNAECHSDRGATLHALGRFEEALAAYDRAITLNPGLASAHYNRGVTLHELARYDAALHSYDRVLELQPDNAEAYNSRGMTLQAMQRGAEALASYDRAIALDPQYADACCNRGVLCYSLGRVDEALDGYQRAIALQPGHVPAHLNMAILKLLAGDYDEGWNLYEWRWKGVQENVIRYFPQPLWLGEQPISGKTLLIYAEQGFGDFIQICRYVEMVEALGAKVVIEAPGALAPLAASLKGRPRVVERGRPLPSFDLQCPIMSLPLAFKTTVGTIPASVPYLYVDADRQKKWQRKLGARTRPRVGLAWSGNVRLKTGQNRILPLDQLKPLLHLPVEFHALQKEFRPEDGATLAQCKELCLHPDDLHDFADTAALIQEMDVVISVDTAVAHLAGALGKPLWVALPYVADWRWMQQRTDSPWYPTATLFRQPALGDWASVVCAIEQRLRAL
jgi:tetratricopeptide (TPR) repeat protein